MSSRPPETIDPSTDMAKLVGREDDVGSALAAVASIAAAEGTRQHSSHPVGGGRAEAGAEMAPASVPVWDIAVRVFHWSLVTAVTVAWLTGGSGHRSHEIAGFAVVGLVAFRLVWGLIGTRHALFKDFVAGPGAIRRYLRDLAHQKAERHLGHNPAGGAMIVTLLALLVLIVTTGYMQLTTAYFGVTWVENLHHYAANTLVALIPLHVVGVIVSSWLHQENLVRSMINGEKPALAAEYSGEAAREHRLLHRVRASEGMTMLMLVVGASAGYGVYVTNGRGAVTPAGEPLTIAAEATSTAAPSSVKSIASTITTTAVAEPAAPQAATTPREATVASSPTETRNVRPQSPTERQDYVISGATPERTTRSWLLSSGGRLYDNWFLALGAPRPTTTHPTWPAENQNVSGAETWRCKTCHGWDYLGRDGQYAYGPGASGAPSLIRVRNRSVEDIVRSLGGPKHQFNDEIMPFDAKLRLAIFLREGTHTVSNYIAQNGTARGNAQLGQAVFENVCSSCHGFDGRQRKLGVSAAPGYAGPPLFVGTKAATNSVEVLHKIRNGHPGAIMVSMRPFPMDVAANVLAYTQTLPTR